MEALKGKLKEYLAMDTEIDFNEFQQYYKKVMDFLSTDYQKLGEEELVEMRYILSTVEVNAVNRGYRKDANMKKFRKMGEKCNFWSGAVKKKLCTEFGYNDSSLEEAERRVDESMRPE